MQKVNIIIRIVSGLGLVLSVIGLVLLIIRNEPFLPELSIDALIEHPLIWVIISGFIFFPSIFQPLAENEK